MQGTNVKAVVARDPRRTLRWGGVTWSGAEFCGRCAIRHLVLFAGLKEQDFVGLHGPIEAFDVPRRALLYRAGGKGDHIFTLRSGFVKLVHYLPDGAQRIVRLLRSGDTLGLEALLGDRYGHDAIALERSAVCRIPVSVVARLDRLNPRLHRELLRRWQRALAAAEDWLVELTTGPARVRMARLLIRQANVAPELSFRLLAREDMAAILGITMETASRTIAEFKRARFLIAADDGKVRAVLPLLRQVVS